jgi:predicted AAA+ superfamily ATPase
MARVISNDILNLKLSESLAAHLPPHTPRDIRLPQGGNKAMAIIGVRRGGKTSFLHRHIANRLRESDDPGTHLPVSLEGERHVGMTAEDLDRSLEERRRGLGAMREAGRRTVYVDKTQVVPG